MTSRHELLLHVLCVCVRALTFDQAMRLLGIRDEANFRRFLKPLVAAGLVNVVRVLAKPVPEMSEPLFTWPTVLHRSTDVTVEIAFGGVLYRAARRWADVSAALTTCIVATRKAGQLYGVKRSELPAKLLQATHDLAVAQALLVMRRIEPVHAEGWQGEDFNPFCRIGEKSADAAIMVGRAPVPKKLIEIVGADYTHDKLLAIHRECNSRGLTYELW